MTILPRTPGQIEAKLESQIQTLLTADNEFAYAVIDSLRAAEDALPPQPVPQKIVHFFTTALHAIDDEAHASLLDGLALLDQALDDNAVVGSFEDLDQELLKLKSYVVRDIGGDPNQVSRHFDALLARAKLLAENPEFQSLAQTSSPNVQKRIEDIRGGELVKIQRLLDERQQELAADGAEIDAATPADSYLQELLNLKNRVSGNWVARRRNAAISSLDGRGAFG